MTLVVAGFSMPAAIALVVWAVSFVRARRQAAGQPPLVDQKTLDQLDWDALQGVARPKILELARCQFIDEAQDVVIAGPIGTGKTHLAIALGVEAARRRIPVGFVKAAELVQIGRAHV